MLILAGLGLILVVTAATGFFVAAEFAYVAVDRNRLARAAEQGDPAAERAVRIAARLSFMLSGAQLGITVTALLAGFVAEPYLGRGMADLLGVAGVPAALSVPLSVGTALLVATIVQMVLGELAPKNWAIAEAETLARALSRPVLVYLRVAGPLITFFDAAAVGLLRALRIEPVQELPQGATAEDLDRIIAVSHAAGELDAYTSRLLDRGLDFRRRTAAGVMTPRVDIVMLAADDPVRRVVELLDTGHSRFPVYGASRDDVVGVVGLAEVVTVPPPERASTPVGAVAAPPFLVPDSMPLPKLLDLMRAEHRQLACVVDEFGGFAGVVSFEDVAEELVGEILDEDDPVAEGARAQADGSWLVPGRWRVDEVTEATGIPLPASPGYATVGGLVTSLLGRLPRTGDRVDVPLPDPGSGADEPPRAVLEVVAVDGRVPQVVRIGVQRQAAVGGGR